MRGLKGAACKQAERKVVQQVIAHPNTKADGEGTQGRRQAACPVQRSLRPAQGAEALDR